MELVDLFQGRSAIVVEVLRRHVDVAEGVDVLDGLLAFGEPAAAAVPGGDAAFVGRWFDGLLPGYDLVHADVGVFGVDVAHVHEHVCRVAQGRVLGDVAEPSQAVPLRVKGVAVEVGSEVLVPASLVQILVQVLDDFSFHVFPLLERHRVAGMSHAILIQGDELSFVQAAE